MDDGAFSIHQSEGTKDYETSGRQLEWLRSRFVTFAWMHFHVLTQSTDSKALLPEFTPRSFCNSLAALLNTLSSIQDAFVAASTQYSQLEKILVERLSWASKTDLKLSTLLAQFGDVVGSSLYLLTSHRPSSQSVQGDAKQIFHKTRQWFSMSAVSRRG